MLRLAITLICAIVLANFGRAAGADQDAALPPTTYEVLVNGESFRVEADRLTKVQSAKSGGSYELVVRVAPTQVLRLNTVRLEYDMPASVSDDRGRQRSVQIKHQLGFTILLTDLGGPLDAKDQKDALKARTDAIVKLYPTDSRPSASRTKRSSPTPLGRG